MTHAAQQNRKKTHLNDERTVHCPVEDCDATPLARGVHLHVMRSSGDGHGPQGDVPSGISFENLDTAGKREVSMDYPEHRETEGVRRLCPYCRQPFHGKHGVQIHLGQVAGDETHPEDATERYDPEDYPIAHVDQHGNVQRTYDGEAELPTTKRRRNETEELRVDVDELRDVLDDEAVEKVRERFASAD